ncbi:MAG TPA: glucokinase [Gammaproteobacteria bacterium]|nr:glucokinase [Gammaproteobacteria bacterium]
MANRKIRVLAGDIGGTKTRLAVFDVSGDVSGDVMGEVTDTVLQMVAEEVYPSRDYQTFAEIVQLFMDRHRCGCESACFGVAGPVRNGVATTTNLPWRLVASELAEELEVTQVALLNDLEANAWGIQTLATDDLCVLQDGAQDLAGNAAVIAAGTGLGEAGMYRDGRRYRPFATEGGHTNFCPANELEYALFCFLLGQFAHVSWERVLSGPGLVNIHTFLRAYRSSEAPGWLTESLYSGDPAAVISQAALQERDEICIEALDLFVHFYGVEAGNLALKMMASGGVYLGGGIAPKIIEKLQGELFMQGFRSKGRMQYLLESMPVQVILNDRTALYGPAVFGALSVSD